MKKLFLLGLSLCIVTFLFNFMVFKNHQSTETKFKLLLKHVEALASNEAGENGGSGESAWQNKRLQKVDCTCQVGKKEVKGFTLQCRENGQLEKCSATQQGSNACYDISVWYQDLKIICEGDFTVDG